MRYVVAADNIFLVSCVSGVKTEILWGLVCRSGAKDNEVIQRLSQKLYVMDIGPGHHCRYRKAVPFGEDAAFGSFFFRDPLGWPQQIPTPKALWSCNHPGLAIPSQDLSARRTYTARQPISPRKNRNMPISGNIGGYCSPWGWISIGILSAAHTVLPPGSHACQGACGPHQAYADSSCSRRVDVVVYRVLLLPRTHPILSMTCTPGSLSFSITRHQYTILL